MMRKKVGKRVISMIIMAVMMLNSISVVYANSSSGDILSDNETLGLDSVYVDGTQFDFNFDIDTGDILLTGEAGDSSAEMTLYGNGDDSKIEICNDDVMEEYTVDIDELTDNEVDVDVYEDGRVIESYNSYDELMSDQYDGQEAITFSLVFTVALVLTIVSTYVIVHNHKNYLSASEFYNSIENAKAKVREKAREWYYPAWVDAANHMTWILPSKISLKDAAGLICSNIDVYSFTNSMAKKAITEAGFKPYSSNGSSAEIHENNISKRFVFYHWHKGDKTTGKRCKENCHSLYGVPHYVK